MDTEAGTLGALVLDEQILPIASLALAESRLLVTVKVAIGRVRHMETVDYAVHGRDGSLVWRGRVQVGPFNVTLADDHEIDLTVNLGIAQQRAWSLD